MPNVKLSDKTTRTAASISNETIVYFVGIEIDGSPELLKMATPQLRTLLGIGGVSDGDKGDIVISSAGTVYTIDAGVLSAFGRTLTVTANAAAARGVLGLGTSATLNVGTSANNVVQLDGTSKLPAVDGSMLINLPAAGSAITSLTGNVTATGPGAAAATIANDAVTYAKMQNVSAISKLLGRGSAGGVGDVEEITLGTNLSMSGTTLNAAGGGGGSPAGANTEIQFNNAGAFGASNKLFWTGSTLSVNSATITSYAEAFNTTQTWNNGAVNFYSAVIYVTDTASGAGSTPFAIYVGGAEKFGVQKGGHTVWSLDTGIDRAAAGVLTITNASTGGGSLEFREQTPPASPSANSVRIFSDDSAGDTRLRAIVSDGTTHTIASKVATNTIKGRTTAGSGVVEDLTPAQARTVIASDSGGGTTNFFRADGTFAAPAGGGSPGGSNTHIQFNNSGALGGSANLTWDGTTVAISGGTLTGASAPPLSLTQTWNNVATTFTGLLLNVTNTTSAAASKLLDLQVGGSTRLSVNADTGIITSQSSVATDSFTLGAAASKTSLISQRGVNIQAGSGWSIELYSPSGAILLIAPNVCYLQADASNTLSVRNAGSANAIQVYKTWSSATNYERGIMDWIGVAGTFRVGTQKGSGGGSAMPMALITDDIARMTVTTDGAFDIPEITAPAAPAANIARLYVDDSGGKTRLMVRFPTGAAQQIAIEP